MSAAYRVADLELRPVTRDDLAQIAEMLQKSGVCRYLFFGPNTREQTEAYFLSLIGSTEGRHVFVLRRGGTLAGYCALIGVAYSPGHYTIGYILDEEFWGQGYGTAVCRFLVGYGFGTLGARRLSGECMGGNRASRRIMERCGFALEGRRPGYWLKEGRMEDELLFGLFRT